MANFVTNAGKEYVFDETQDGDTLTVLLFDNTTDGLAEGDNLSAITTEPDDADTYERQDTLISTLEFTGDYGFENDSEIAFDVETNTETVDSAGYIANFESSVEGDTEASDNLVAVGALSETRNLDEFDQITIPAGDLELIGQNL